MLSSADCLFFRRHFTQKGLPDIFLEKTLTYVIGTEKSGSGEVRIRRSPTSEESGFREIRIPRGPNSEKSKLEKSKSFDDRIPF
ncbi:unnamed protein product [Cuscuta campestris]|uniref:Uncharacterized protein n=1 Tax=Cuscuta campestris TaxID=132261 RepID=A0A484NBQ6_9ASTE|nr:unnamed protein product [Cuscuta campestris]